MNPRRWLLRAGLGRVLLESGVLTAALTILLLAGAGGNPNTRARTIVIGLGAVAIGLLVAALAALRLRRQEGGRRLAREVGCGAAVLGLAVALSWSLIRAGTAWLMPPALNAGIDPLSTAVVYAAWRGAVLGWPAWDRLRRARLLWAMTHAQWVAGLTLAAVVTVLLTLGSLRAAGGHLPAGPQLDGPAAVVAWAAILLILATNLLLVLTLAVSIIVIPAATLIALPVLRGATRRIEDLAAAAAALRSGALATRVPVTGDDEVARLQSDFNAMAAALERTLGELEAERGQVARLLQARRELIAAVSHELRTPLAILRGYLESAQADEQWGERPPPSLRADLTIMARETEQLQRLIDDLFTLSRVEVGRLPLTLEPVVVGALLRRVCDALARLAWERGRVEVLADVADDLPPARADGARLEQIVGNLLTNAVRHTPPGGLVLLSAVPEGDAVVVQVKDTGAGIAAEDLPHIWERFYRGATSRSDSASGAGGAGIGLALVKELTEAMGGTVEVESVVGQGSCFTIRLPAVRAAPTPPAELPIS